MTHYAAADGSAHNPLQQRHRRAWDVVLGWALYAIAVALGLVTAFNALMFGMLSDACAYQSCHEEYITWSIGLSWGGTVLALGAALAMLVVSTINRWLMWYWPVLAMAIIIVSSVGGFIVASQVTSR